MQGYYFNNLDNHDLSHTHTKLDKTKLKTRAPSSEKGVHDNHDEIVKIAVIYYTKDTYN